MQYFVSRVGFSFHNFQAEFAANVAAVHSSSGHLGLIALSGISIGVILANVHVRVILMMPFAVNPQVLEEREPLSALVAGVVLLDVLLLMLPLPRLKLLILLTASCERRRRRLL